MKTRIELKPKIAVLINENASITGYLQFLPEAFQGFHLRENCPFFKGGSCPNCEVSTEQSQEKKQ